MEPAKAAPLEALCPNRNEAGLSSTHKPDDMGTSPENALDFQDFFLGPQSGQCAAEYRFEFKGLTIWIEGDWNDIQTAISRIACDHQVQAIPAPHATVVYGMEDLTIDEGLARLEKLADLVRKAGGWPDLVPCGTVCGSTLDGVDGEEMDMTWMEVTCQTSPEHEQLIALARTTFGAPPASGAWLPHISLGYDNPPGHPDNVREPTLSCEHLQKLVEETPSLVNSNRKVKGLSLWSTEGKLSEWRRLGYRQL